MLRSMIALLKKIWAWQAQANWRTWVTHTGIAFLYAGLLTPVLGWSSACVAVVFSFLVREGEQALLTALASGKQPWLDRACDVLAPAIGLGLASWLL